MGNKPFLYTLGIGIVIGLILMVLIAPFISLAKADEACAPGNLLSHTQEIVKASPEDFSLEVITEPVQRDAILKALADMGDSPSEGIDSIAVVIIKPDDKVLLGFVSGGCVKGYIIAPTVETWERFKEKVLGQRV